MLQVFLEMIVMKTEMESPWYSTLTLENEPFLEINTKPANNLKCENTDGDYKLNINYMVYKLIHWILIMAFGI